MDERFGGVGGLDAFVNDALGVGAGGGNSGVGAAAAAVANDELWGQLSEEQGRQMARQFEQSRGVDGFVMAEDGRRQLERTGLSNEMLQNIWHLSDLDRDGRLSLREFVCAMHLADQARNGRALPVEVRPEQQVTLVRGVEGFVSQGPPTSAFPEASKPGRHEDFSTVDTAASLGPSRRNGAHRRQSELDSVTEADFSTLGSRAGALGLDGRGGASGNGGALAGISDIDEGVFEGRGLSQLAAVFEVVARLDAGGELKRLSMQVLEERKELEKHLSRRREYERQLAEVRKELDSMRDERRQVEMDTAATQRRISHLQDELAFVEGETRSAESDLNMLRDAGGPGSPAGSRGPAPYSTPEDERRDVLSKVRAEREMLHRDQRGIEEIRTQLDGIFKMKLDTQVKQQSLLEKQRQAEQDRGLMLTAIEAERGQLSAMRAERLKLWEERSGLEREMADITQQELQASQLPAGRPPATAPASGGRGIPGYGASQAAASAGQGRTVSGVRQEEVPSVVYGSAPSGLGEPAGVVPAAAPRFDHKGVRN